MRFSRDVGEIAVPALAAGEAAGAGLGLAAGDRRKPEAKLVQRGLVPAELPLLDGGEAVAAQRRLGDHDTHLRLDIAGYRERRKASLEAFARKIAQQVRESGKALAIEPMASPDRKVIHDVLASEEGVSTASKGEDPNRRVIVSPS